MIKKYGVGAQPPVEEIKAREAARKVDNNPDATPKSTQRRSLEIRSG